MSQVSGQSFSVQPYSAYQEFKKQHADGKTGLEPIERYDDNGKVDLIMDTESEGTVKISGEKIDLEELGTAYPEIDLGTVAQYDRNEDGFIEESELKISIADYASAIGNHIVENPEVIALSAAGGMWGGAIAGGGVLSLPGAIGSGIAGAFIGTFIANDVDFIGSYKTPEFSSSMGSTDKTNIIGLR